MSLSFSCSGCGKHYKVADELAGKRFKCKACGQAITVPDPLAEMDRDEGLAGAPIDWNGIAQTEEQVQVEPIAAAKAPRVPFKMPKMEINSYRLARLLIGIVLCVAGGLLILLVFTHATADNPSFKNENDRRKTQMMFGGIGFALLVLGGSLSILPTSEEEKNSPLLSSLSPKLKWGYPGASVAFLILLLAQGDQLATQLAALALVIVGVLTIFSGLKMFMADKESRRFKPASTDRVLIGLVPLLVAVPFWIYRLQYMIANPSA
ncbi:MAG: hypothetical protein WD768_01555 [Phycisphaeraceae bacterium]